MLGELVGDYTAKEGSYIFTLSEGGSTVKFILKQFDYFNGKGVYCYWLLTPIYIFNKNFRPSEELLQKISTVNADISPGSLNLIGSNLVYMSYFWDDELNKTVLRNEIVTAFINTAKLQKEMDTFMGK
jgi:hypothetical protein